MRCLTRLTGAAVWMVLILLEGCRPANGKMLVTCVQGDVFLPNLRSCIWNPGEVLDCEIASRGTQTVPDQRGDLLLCGAQTQMAWSQAGLRGDIKSELYKNARELDVTFHSVGHESGRFGPPIWTCKMSEIIDCE